MSTYTDNGSAVSIGVQGYASHADSAGLEAYCEYADQAGLDYRLRVMAHHEARGQYLRILEEIDAGIEITQAISAEALRAARLAAYFAAPKKRRPHLHF